LLRGREGKGKRERKRKRKREGKKERKKKGYKKKKGKGGRKKNKKGEGKDKANIGRRGGRNQIMGGIGGVRRAWLGSGRRRSKRGM